MLPENLHFLSNRSDVWCMGVGGGFDLQLFTAEESMFPLNKSLCNEEMSNPLFQ